MPKGKVGLLGEVSNLCSADPDTLGGRSTPWPSSLGQWDAEGSSTHPPSWVGRLGRLPAGDHNWAVLMGGGGDQT